MNIASAREVHAVPSPQLSVEDGIALLSKTALEQRDQQLVTIAADAATAYGTGRPEALERPFAQLQGYLMDLYAAGTAPSRDLLRASYALQEAVGGYDRATMIRRREIGKQLAAR